jgi:hypothetical protein
MAKVILPLAVTVGVLAKVQLVKENEMLSPAVAVLPFE